MAPGTFAMRFALPLTAGALLGAAVWGTRGSERSDATPHVPEGIAPTVDSTATRCRGPEFHRFDFWVGDWEVRNPKGAVLGHDRVHRVADGCGLLERWEGADGGHGSSINTYDSDVGRWTQRWVGGGATLWLLGDLDDGAMVLVSSAPRTTPRGRVLDRISWTPLPDGRVRQLWEISADGGTSWKTGFEGLYSRAPSR